MARTSQEVVIVGGGAGGQELAVRLAGHDNLRLIDSGKTHVWQAAATRTRRRVAPRPRRRGSASPIWHGSGFRVRAPPTAQVASEQAAHLARELPRYLAGERPADFDYRDKGTLRSLGQAGSVGRIRWALGSDVKIGGRLAHAAYRGLQRRHHQMLLGPIKCSVRIVGGLLKSEGRPGLKVH